MTQNAPWPPLCLESQAQDIARRILAGEHVLLAGGRMAGKTTLRRRVQEIIQASPNDSLEAG